ncbi:MAG: esterase-like activity of phytase family protein [Prevotella sp.]|nr:esterase-like activity of phytase family protein [Prevotella sp.]
MIRRICCFVILLIAFSQTALAQVEFVKECAQKSFPDSIPAGNYSGITHIEGDEYAVVSDKSDTDGFFVFKIDIDSVSGEISSVRNMGFHGDSMRDADCEGIFYRPSSSTFFISRESDNAIAEYDNNGKATGRQMEIPEIYKNAVNNYGFESLTYDEQQHLFWTVNESTLSGDGDYATSTNGVRNILRIQSFDDQLKPQQQFAYMMDAPISNAEAGNYAMGVSEMTAIGDGRLLVLEREFYVPKAKIGAFVQCKLYEITPEDNIAISPDEPISENTPFIQKRLVHSFTTKLSLFNHAIANYEGMCLGPTLTDGSRTLVLVSDSQNQYAGVLKDWFKTLVIKF